MRDLRQDLEDYHRYMAERSLKVIDLTVNSLPHAIERAIKAEAEVTKWQDVAEQRLENALVVAQKVCRLEAENAKLRKVVGLISTMQQSACGYSARLVEIEMLKALEDYQTWKEGQDGKSI